VTVVARLAEVIQNVETGAKERQRKGTMRNVRGNWLTELLSKMRDKRRREDSLIKLQEEVRKEGLLDVRKAPTCVLQESQADRGLVTGAPLEAEAVQSDCSKGGSALTIGVGDVATRLQVPGRAVSGSHAEERSANQSAVSHPSALRYHVKAAEVHIKG
jgi:hypothetical protein